jgi:hypothetical protein
MQITANARLQALAFLDGLALCTRNPGDHTPMIT